MYVGWKVHVAAIYSSKPYEWIWKVLSQTNWWYRCKKSNSHNATNLTHTNQETLQCCWKLGWQSSRRSSTTSSPPSWPSWACSRVSPWATSTTSPPGCSQPLLASSSTLPSLIWCQNYPRAMPTQSQGDLFDIGLKSDHFFPELSSMAANGWVCSSTSLGCRWASPLCSSSPSTSTSSKMSSGTTNTEPRGSSKCLNMSDCFFESPCGSHFVACP